jgi:hypothetical protein
MRNKKTAAGSSSLLLLLCRRRASTLRFARRRAGKCRCFSCKVVQKTVKNEEIAIFLTSIKKYRKNTGKSERNVL